VLSPVANAIDRIPKCLPALLVFFALSSPAEAVAGCGGHVTYGGGREDEAPAPCQGPGCSQAPQTPPLAPAPVPRPTIDAALAAPCVVALEAGTWFGHPHLESHVIHRVHPPDPPPRDRQYPEL
jgi:hypothetical protein